MKSSEKNVTLNDVANHSGVSYQTVSRVINDHPSVAETTRKRVIESIRELNYRPNWAARSLATNRSETIAIISFGTTFYGPAQMLANITYQAKNRGYRVSPSMVQKLQPEDIKIALDELHGQLIDGIIIIAPIVSDFMSEISELVGDIPFVQIDTQPRPNIASVVIEQAYGSKLATNHLIDLGHRQIAEISGPLNWYDGIMRHQSWIKILEEHNLSHDMSVEGNWSAKSGYEALKSLLKRGEEFTGLVVANDQMALGAIAALNEANLRVPHDISVVGFDDIPEAAYYLPALTTVCQDFSALGKYAVEYLVSLIEKPELSIQQRVLYPELIIRNSTASLK
ncbi:MAG: LacI family DNA-binding transcriptional regulator [Aggregatilineales bacterium]